MYGVELASGMLQTRQTRRHQALSHLKPSQESTTSLIANVCGIERQDMAQHRNRHRQQLVAVLLGQEVQLVGGCATLAKMTNEMYRVRVAQLNILHRESESSPVLHHSDVALS